MSAHAHVQQIRALLPLLLQPLPPTKNTINYYQRPIALLLLDSTYFEQKRRKRDDAPAGLTCPVGPPLAWLSWLPEFGGPGAIATSIR